MSYSLECSTTKSQDPCCFSSPKTTIRWPASHSLLSENTFVFSSWKESARRNLCVHSSWEWHGRPISLTRTTTLTSANKCSLNSSTMNLYLDWSAWILNRPTLPHLLFMKRYSEKVLTLRCGLLTPSALTRTWFIPPRCSMSEPTCKLCSLSLKSLS